MELVLFVFMILFVLFVVLKLFVRVAEYLVPILFKKRLQEHEKIRQDNVSKLEGMGIKVYKDGEEPPGSYTSIR